MITIAFANHKKLACHKDAVKIIIVLPATTPDVAEMLSSAKIKEREVNSQCLLKVFWCIYFLAKQGLPLCGDEIGEKMATSLKHVNCLAMKVQLLPIDCPSLQTKGLCGILKSCFSIILSLLGHSLTAPLGTMPPPR